MNDALYFAPSYFSPYYFTSLASISDTTQPPSDTPLEYRDRDAFNAICKLLESTGEFASVNLGTVIDKGSISIDRLPLAAIQPQEWLESDDSDPTLLLRQVVFDIIVVCRAESPEVAIDTAGRLSSIVQNSLNGSSLNGGCLPALTMIRHGKLHRKTSRYPEQRTILRGEFSYFVQSIDGHGNID